MSRTLCLTRQCLGLVTRIECVILPLAGDNGLWTLICAAGISGTQPSAIRAQGPFHGPFIAESVMASIADCLGELGYCPCEEPMTWRLHQQAELRRLNQTRGRTLGNCLSRPDS
ncbi:hypothetical protein QMA71_10915 [Pseudomonas otitidis]|uniref:PA4575 family protein n=1 Tax=Metapseudomonas otitidis TaxID=319939 RepID=UPI0024AE877C|nr:hypothetical protein [Pseudomonas otitidis]MDI6526041.1 hypothetical protein [Pseudomonas otitidis]